jgi:hypothetical protein
MTALRKFGLLGLMACLSGFPCGGQCGFSIMPAAAVRWYRGQGWSIPGLSDAKSVRPMQVTVDGAPKTWPKGLTVAIVTHDDPYRVRFPEAIFEEGGTHKKMLAGAFDLKQMLRWEMNGRTYAYSYWLLPKDIGCDASIDLIDDRGDGRFRLLISPGHVIKSSDPQPPPVPEWLIHAKS